MTASHQVLSSHGAQGGCTTSKATHLLGNKIAKSITNPKTKIGNGSSSVVLTPTLETVMLGVLSRATEKPRSSSS